MNPLFLFIRPIIYALRPFLFFALGFVAGYFAYGHLSISF